MMKKIILIAVGVAIFGACSSDKGEISQPAPAVPGNIRLTEDQMKSVNLKVDSLRPMTLPVAIKASGFIDLPPGNYASVSVLMAGYVKNVSLLEGDRVERGQALARLENPAYLDLQENYLKSKNRLNYLKEEWERQKMLGEENINARKSLLKSEADYKDALAEYSSGQAKLRMIGIDPGKLESQGLAPYINIVSPISGYISKVNAAIGKYVEPAEVLFEVIDDSHLHLMLNVYEHDIARIRKGQKILFKAPGFDDRIYQAEVYLVGKVLEGESRTAQVHAHIIDEKKYQFVSNMYVDASIIVDEKEGLALSEQGVVKSGGKSYIFLKTRDEDGQPCFRRVEVTAGVSSEGFIPIIFNNEQPAEMEAVTEGAFYLASVFENEGAE